MTRKICTNVKVFRPRVFPDSSLLQVMSISVAVVAVVLHCGEFVRADLVTLRSGNGTVGGTDSLITMLVGPANTSFSSAFTPSDFADARIGPAAILPSPPSGAWISGLPSDTMAQWISTNVNGAFEASTALYAIDFTLADPAASATLDLKYSVDNVLGGGGGPNQGVFLNGTAISGNSTGGHFGAEFTIARNDIAPLLNVGTNTLYINATDVGGPAGLIFSATIETSAIPEPNAAILLSSILGISGLGVLWKRARSRRKNVRLL